MPDVVYERFDGGTVTVTFNTGNQRVTGVTVVNPTGRTWRGQVYDPASRQPDGSYTVGYALEVGPGQTVSRPLPAGALRMRATTVDVDGEQVADFELLNTATALWERPVPYSSTMI